MRRFDPRVYIGMDELAEQLAKENAMDKRFTETLISAAQAAQARYYVPASVTLAQWALESAYGTHMPPGSNNPFGIKAKAGQAVSVAMTWEVENGRDVRTTARFAKYGSITEAFEAHAALLRNVGLYALAIKCWTSGKTTALSDGVRAMAIHYATDPEYYDKIMHIIETNALATLDNIPEAIAPQPPKSNVPAQTKTENTAMLNTMPTALAGGLLSALFTYGPKVASLATHGIANSADIKAKGADLIKKLSEFDLPDATVDFQAIMADLGVTTDQVAAATAAAAAPAVSVPSNIASVITDAANAAAKTLGV